LNKANWKAPVLDQNNQPFELGVVVSFGYLIPLSITNAMSCVNIHPSLLPRHRGASPIQTSILSGDAETGVCIISVEPEIDAGRILHSIKIPLLPTATFSKLHETLMPIASDALLYTLKNFPSCWSNSVSQDASKVSFAPKIKKESGLVDWNSPAATILRKWRALDGFLPVYSYFNGKRIALYFDPFFGFTPDSSPLRLSTCPICNVSLPYEDLPGECSACGQSGTKISTPPAIQRPPGSFWFDQRYGYLINFMVIFIF
jgi:methionyl-tRNA formyltransferase